MLFDTRYTHAHRKRGRERNPIGAEVSPADSLSTLILPLETSVGWDAHNDCAVTFRNVMPIFKGFVEFGGDCV